MEREGATARRPRDTSSIEKERRKTRSGSSSRRKGRRSPGGAHSPRTSPGLSALCAEEGGEEQHRHQSSMLAGVFTCTACASAFNSHEEQREHYKLDWHRYNLKRKVAGLAPVPEQTFQARLAAVMGMSVKKPEYHGTCKLCRKSFSSKGLHDQHNASKKHRQMVAKMAKKNGQVVKQRAAPLLDDEGSDGSEADSSDSSDSEAEDGVQEEEEVAATPEANIQPPAPPSKVEEEGAGVAAMGTPSTETAVTISTQGLEGEGKEEGQEAVVMNPPKLGPTACLFCSKVFKDVDANCEHMLKEHGFFIPDAEYLVDLEGLVTYLGEKVKLGLMCLYCNGKGKGFHSYRAVQQHMIDSGHCKLLYEEGQDAHEYDPFYDFSASYLEAGAEDLVEEEEEEEEMKVSGVKEEGDIDMEEAKGGDDAVLEGEEGEEADEKEAQKYIKMKRTMYVSHLGELVLLDGKKLGHRELQRYYKQNVRAEEDRAGVLALQSEQHTRLLKLYGKGGATAANAKAARRGGGLSGNRSNTQEVSTFYSGMTASAAVVRSERKARRRHQMWVSRQHLRTGESANKLNRHKLLKVLLC